MNWHVTQSLEMQSLKIINDASLASIGHLFSLNWDRLIEDRISNSARIASCRRLCDLSVTDLS